MPGSGQEALPDDRECSRVLPGCPGVFGSSSRMSGSGRRHSRISGSGQVALPVVREWSGDPAKCLGGVGRPPGCPRGFADVWEWSRGLSECPGVVGRRARISGSGQVALPNVREWWEALPDVQEASRMSGSVKGPPECLGGPAGCSVGPFGCPGLFERPSRMSGRPYQMSESGREALSDVWEWSGISPRCPGGVGTPFRMSGSCREPLKDVRQWSGHPSKCPGVIGRPSRTAERAFRPLPDIRACLPDIQEGTSKHSRTSERASCTSERDS